MTVDDGTTNRECTVLDVSPGGARIVTDAAIDVRGTGFFELALIQDHGKHRQCEVVGAAARRTASNSYSEGQRI